MEAQHVMLFTFAFFIGGFFGWISGVLESRYLYRRMMRTKACGKEGCPNRVLFPD